MPLAFPTLKLPFLVTAARLVISKTLAAPSPGLCLPQNGRDTAVTCLLGKQW